MMSDRLMTELVTKQSFDPLKTAANATLKQAARTYRNREMTKSANLFLKA
jgi:Spy/CpxP family protein refolding chaperone